MISKILVPTDGSETARKAFSYAVDLAKQLNASIIILTIIDSRPFAAQIVPAEDTPIHVPEPVEDYLREAAVEYTEEIKQMCDEKGVRSESIIRKGHPVEDIVKEAERAHADLIVMGSHGRSALAAAVLGSVTYGVVHNETRIPVLIVRR
jgi:nucleotide-binding universal stress UspA family protein